MFVQFIRQNIFNEKCFFIQLFHMNEMARQNFKKIKKNDENVDKKSIPESNPFPLKIEVI